MSAGTAASATASLLALINRGVLHPGKNALVCNNRQGRQHFADLCTDGRIVFRGSKLASASAFAKLIRGKCNGWTSVYHVVGTEHIPLDALRKGIKGLKGIRGGFGRAPAAGKHHAKRRDESGDGGQSEEVKTNCKQLVNRQVDSKGKAKAKVETEASGSAHVLSDSVSEFSDSDSGLESLTESGSETESDTGSRSGSGSRSESAAGAGSGAGSGALGAALEASDRRSQTAVNRAQASEHVASGRGSSKQELTFVRALDVCGRDDRWRSASLYRVAGAREDRDGGFLAVLYFDGDGDDGGQDHRLSGFSSGTAMRVAKNGVVRLAQCGTVLKTRARAVRGKRPPRCVPPVQVSGMAERARRGVSISAGASSSAAQRRQQTPDSDVNRNGGYSSDGDEFWSEAGSSITASDTDDGAATSNHGSTSATARANIQSLGVYSNPTLCTTAPAIWPKFELAVDGSWRMARMPMLVPPRWTEAQSVARRPRKRKRSKGALKAIDDASLGRHQAAEPMTDTDAEIETDAHTEKETETEAETETDTDTDTAGQMHSETGTGGNTSKEAGASERLKIKMKAGDKKHSACPTSTLNTIMSDACEAATGGHGKDEDNNDNDFASDNPSAKAATATRLPLSAAARIMVPRRSKAKAKAEREAKLHAKAKERARAEAEVAQMAREVREKQEAAARASRSAVAPPQSTPPIASARLVDAPQSAAARTSAHLLPPTVSAAVRPPLPPPTSSPTEMVASAARERLLPPLVVVVDIDNTLLHASFDHDHWVEAKSGSARITAAAANVAAVAGCTLATCEWIPELPPELAGTEMRELPSKVRAVLAIPHGALQFLRQMHSHGAVGVAYTHGTDGYARAVLAVFEKLLRRPCHTGEGDSGGHATGSGDGDDTGNGADSGSPSSPFFGAGGCRVISRSTPAHASHAGIMSADHAPSMFAASIGTKTLAAVASVLEQVEPDLMRHVLEVNGTKHSGDAGGDSGRITDGGYVPVRDGGSACSEALAACTLVVDDNPQVWEGAVRQKNLLWAPPFRFEGFDALDFEGSYRLAAAAGDVSDGLAVTGQVLCDVITRRAEAGEKAEREAAAAVNAGFLPGALPDVRVLLEGVRRKVLEGCRLVFSRVFPTDQAPKDVGIVQDALMFGATCAEMDEGDDHGKRNDEMKPTHVVSTTPSTHKALHGEQLGLHVVHLSWLTESIRLYKRQDESKHQLMPRKYLSWKQGDPESQRARSGRSQHSKKKHKTTHSALQGHLKSTLERSIEIEAASASAPRSISESNQYQPSRVWF